MQFSIPSAFNFYLTPYKMKKIYSLIILCSVLFHTSLIGQFTCGQDTLQYGRAKADLADGVLAGLGLSGPFTAAGQRFEVPTGASVEVSGFTLFAKGFNGDASVRCAIYDADPTSGLPTGAVLSMVELIITTTDSISYINFDSPVTMTQDFVISTENLSPTPLIMSTNNGMVAAGQGEQLALLLFQGNWVVAETAGPPGAFNLDFIMEPFVNYDITAGANSDVVSNTVYADSIYNFTSDHSPLVGSRFFNIIAFNDFFGSSITSPTDWNFGDGSSVDNGDTLAHTFPTGTATYTVTTTATIEGFTTTCEDITETTLNVFVPTSYTCGQDTLQYGRAKADLVGGVLAGIGLSGPFTAAGQRFEVPTGATVEVSGFTLFAQGINGNASVRGAIYETDLTTGLPNGAALAMVNFTIATTDSISYINFDFPVTMTQDFVISAEILSAAPLGMYTNDGMVAAGQGEQLALLLFQGNWVIAETVGPPGAFNFDFIMEPFVNYDITAGVSSDVITNTVYADSLYNFTSDHSPLLGSRFFNKIAFDQFFSSTTTSPTNWDFGDASPVENGEMLTHIFPAGAATYTVTTTATMEGYTTSCEDIIEISYDVEVINSTVNNLLESSISIYPNPTNGYSQLSFELENAKKVNISVFNLLGMQVATYSLGEINNASLEMDLSNQPSGIYLIEIEINGQSMVEKLMVN